MSAIDPQTMSLDELLSSIEAALHPCANDAGELRDARVRLNAACGSLDGAADEEWLGCARIVADLMEIAACSADGMGSTPDDMDDELRTFLQSSIAQLKRSIEEPTDSDGLELAVLVEQAQDQWGEHLELMAEERLWCDDRPTARVEKGETSVADASLLSPSAGDVKQLLSALVGVTPGRDAEAPARKDDKQQAATTNRAPKPQSEKCPSHVFDGQVSGAPEAPPLAAQVELDAPLLEAYLEDASQCLGAIEQSVLRFEQNPSEPATIQEVCRELHTLKGASASVGLNDLATYLHQVEEWLGSATVASDVVRLDPVLQCVDAVQQQIATLQSVGTKANARSGGTSSGGGELSESGRTAPARLTDIGSSGTEETVRVKAAQLDRLMDLLAELVILRNRRDGRVTQLDHVQDELSRCVLRLQSVSDEHPASSRSRGSAGRPRSEVSEVADDIREIARSVRQLRQPIADEDRAITQFIGQFRQELVGLRRQPLSGLFRRLQRVARDAAQVESKRVHLQLVGEHAGLERSLQERLYEPLLHMIRNAVSHGIESEEQRVRLGKNPVGTITLEAMGSSHLLVLEIRDDGRGLDYEAIRRRGLERGLLVPDRPASERELSRLIFHPGFSTRESSNEVSGRGVGMDVVATTLERLHCLIEVDSAPGQGTTFRLTIPLRSVIEHTLVFRCSGQLFGVPMQFVRSAGVSGQEHAVDELDAPPDDLPVLTLNSLLRLPEGDKTSNRRWLTLGHRRLARAGDERTPAGSSARQSRRQVQQRVALWVDEIVGHEEVVVRPLPALLKKHPLLSGTTLSGASEVMLLLDGHRLLDTGLAAINRHGAAAPRQATDAAPSSTSMRHHVLVVDDSLSARMRLVEKLKRFGIDITEAGDGVDALDLLRDGRFDAIFSDLEMPRMSGFDLLAEVKGDSERRKLPMVIVTTRSEDAVRRRAAELKADGFLSKPVSDGALRDTLHKLALIKATKH